MLVHEHIQRADRLVIKWPHTAQTYLCECGALDQIRPLLWRKLSHQAIDDCWLLVPGSWFYCVWYCTVIAMCSRVFTGNYTIIHTISPRGWIGQIQIHTSDTNELFHLRGYICPLMAFFHLPGNVIKCVHYPIKFIISRINFCTAEVVQKLHLKSHLDVIKQHLMQLISDMNAFTLQFKLHK